MNEPLESRVRARLSALERDRLLRSLKAPAGIDLSSNDYLALAAHPRLRDCMIAAVRREGCGSTGSRLLRGDRESFGAVERRFADFKGTERALYFSSGYLANLGVLTTFPETGDLILSDERNHASLIDGIRLSGARCVVFPHNDAVVLRHLLEDASGAGQRFVVTESLFSMDGDLSPLAEYATLCRSAGALLIVDEAHAVGIYGARGTGLIEATGVSSDLFLSINTAGKALGVAGAFVAGAAWAIEYLIQRARPFIFSTAPPPAVAAAIDASLWLGPVCCASGSARPAWLCHLAHPKSFRSSSAATIGRWRSRRHCSYRASTSKPFDRRACGPAPPGSASRSTWRSQSRPSIALPRHWRRR